MTQPAASAVVGATTSHQVVFVGPMGVGKTTAVKALSDIPIVSTDVARVVRHAVGLSTGGNA